jgi:hypothetical protein
VESPGRLLGRLCGVIGSNFLRGGSGAITLPADPDLAVLAQIRASCRGFPSKPSPDDTCRGTPGPRIKSSPPPSHHLRPRRRANPPAAGQREGGSRGYWLVSQRFSPGRLEFADAVLELNDRLPFESPGAPTARRQIRSRAPPRDGRQRPAVAIQAARPYP